MKKQIFVGAVISAIALFLAFLFFRNTTSQAPSLPSLVYDPTATKTIKTENGIYFVEYSKGSEVVKVYVGNSKVELALFVGKPVEINGKLPRNVSEIPDYTRSEQCIVNICKSIFADEAEAIVIDIESVESR